ncbi:MAG: hypothetical protein GY898_31295 [Proteobacteria bacterium]|nr:hypothetical protein [Pseudomonadota bacterium]
MSRLALLLAASVLLAAAPASAEDCTYTDLQGQFTVTVDCAGLGDHTNIGQEQKRMWLAGAWGELQIMELPDPYKTAAHAEVMSNLGRFWTRQRTSQPTTEAQVAGLDGLVVTERKQRSTATTWIFTLDGRNIYVRAVVLGKRTEREARLETMSAAFLAGIKLSE